MLEYSKQDSDLTGDTTDTPAALVVGKVRSTQELWTLLQKVQDIEDCQNGALIIFSQKVRGRVGLSGSRYITGAYEETTGASGLQALKALLSIDNGMFGFRPSSSTESASLNHELTIDLKEMFASWKDAGSNNLTPAAAIDKSGATTAQLDSSDSSSGPEGVADEVKSQEARQSDGESAFAYLKWFSVQVAAHPVDHPEVQTSLPKFSDVLKAATKSVSQSEPVAEPAMPDAASSIAEVDPLATSGQFQKLEMPDDNNVRRDIERSMTRHLSDPREQAESTKNDNELVLRNAEPMATGMSITDAVQKKDIDLFDKTADDPAALVQLEDQTASQRMKAWSHDDLNSIPTPKTLTAESSLLPGDDQSISQKLLRHRGDSLQEHGKPMQTPQDFIKRNSDEEVERESSGFTGWWVEHPLAIAGVCILALGLLFSLVRSDLATHDRDRCISEGRIALKRGNFDDARMLFTEAIGIKPGAHAYFYRAVSYARGGEPEKAIADLNQAMALGESEIRVRTLRASIEAHMGDYDKAIEDASVVIVDDPQSAEAYQIRASSRSHRNEFEATIKDCTTALSFCKDPEIRARLYIERAFAFSKTGKHSDAESDLDKAVEAKPTAFVFMQRGDSYRFDKKYRQAVENYTKVVSIDPRSRDAYVARGISQAAAKNDRQALRDFGRALSIDPANIEALIQRGNIHLGRKEWRMAANDFEEVIDLNPTVAEAHHKLQLAYTHLNKTVPQRYAGSGSTDLDTVKSETLVLPSTVKELIDLGYKKLYSGESSDAIACFSAAVRKEPANPTARKYLAHALIKNGALAEAATQFRTLSTIRPLDGADLLSMAKCYNGSGQAESAYKILTQIVQTNPGSAEAKAELAKACVARGDMAQAIKLCREGVQQAKTADERQLFESIIPAAPGKAPAGSPQSTPVGPGGGA